MTIAIVPPLPPLITFQVETRPSVSTGFSWWAVLKYRDHEFIDLLPHDFPALDEAKRDAAVEESVAKLKARLAPILWAEDGHG